MRSHALRNALTPQAGSYTLAIKETTSTEYRKINVIDQILVASEDPQAVVQALSTCEVVTITVTEKGYHLINGALNRDDPMIEADVLGQTYTIIGLLAAGIRKRAGRPLSVLSCDNLPHNSQLLRQALTQFGSWTGGLNLDNVSFANTMVDRITPACTPKLIAQVARETGWQDAAPVATERFSEWIIEENFATRIPNWSAAGAQIVTDVTPFERRKLRMLNGAHSYLAYAGILAGYNRIDQAIADPILRNGARAIMKAAQKTLRGPASLDAAQYLRALIKRFENHNLAHALRQIANDGSLKIPVRLLPMWHELHQVNDAQSEAPLRGVIAWLQFLRTETEAGRTFTDPQAAALALICAKDWPIMVAQAMALIDAPKEATAAILAISPNPEMAQIVSRHDP